MKRAAIFVACIVLSTLATSAKAGAVKQPKGWDVQYQDASCVVSTRASDAETAWHIKMGYLAGDQLFFIFSAQHDALQSIELPKDLAVWLVADKKDFRSLGISNINGELIISTENSIALQRSLAGARTIGIKTKTPNMKDPILIQTFILENIGGAIKWLRSCNVIGAGALPY